MANKSQETAEASSSGLLSSVFTFVHREFESFVATATGGEPPKAPKASSSRLKLDGAKKGKKDGARKRAVSARKGAQDAVAARQRTRHAGSPRTRDTSNRDASNLMIQAYKKPSGLTPTRRPRSSPSTRHSTSQPAVAPTQKSGKPDDTSVVQDGEASVLPPLPSFLRPAKSSKPITTMPGSLFPRSASLEPDPTPQADYGLLRERVRPSIPSSKTALYPKVSNEYPVASTSKTRSPGEQNPFLGITNTLARARGVVATTEDAKRFLEDFNPSPPSSPSPGVPFPNRTNGTRKTPTSPCVDPDASQVSSKAKGKERAREPESDVEEADTSKVLRVRGKEQELRDAKEEQMRKEQERELDPEASFIMEERERDKERIRKLEAEVAWLKTQLEEQLSMSRINVSDIPSPPPPPPPPPPPMPKAHPTTGLPVTVAGIRRRAQGFSTANTESFLLRARAALKKQPTPVEAPINPLTAPAAILKSTAKAKRTGRPSINVPSEKMDAFLTEVKSAKLKKVNGNLAPPLVRDTATTALARELGASGKGKELLRTLERRKSLSELEMNTRGKRKRDALESDGQFEKAEPATKRIAKESSTGSSTSATSNASTSSTSTFSAAPARRSGGFGLPDHSWPSIATTDTELTTPSLCSDNENDHGSEAGHGYVSPPTPPPRPPTPPRRSRRQSSESRQSMSPDVDRLPEIIDVIDVDADEEFFSPQAVTPRIPGKPQPTVKASTKPPVRPTIKPTPQDLFAKRPPTSPMPKLTPSKPLPPARNRNRSTGSSPRGRTDPSKSQPAPLTTQSSIPVSTNPLSTLVPAKKKKPRRSASTGTNSKQSLVIEPVQPVHEPDSPHIRRRRTLDAELRSAGDHLWQDESVEEVLDNHVYQARGAKDDHRGFLARGGGGGPPVYMGAGYVEGYEDDGRRRAVVGRKQSSR